MKSITWRQNEADITINKPRKKVSFEIRKDWEV